MDDRRCFSRLKTEIDVLLYTKSVEIEATIEDISENGICFKIKDCDFPDIKITNGTIIQFQFIDSYKFGMIEEEEVINAKAKIYRIYKKDNDIIIGCKIKDTVYSSFVTSKKIENLINVLKGVKAVNNNQDNEKEI